MMSEERTQRPAWSASAAAPAGRSPEQYDQGAWGAEPLIEAAGQFNPAAPGAYIIQWRAYFRTNHNAWLTFLAANPTFDVNYHWMTRAAYLTALPFPGPRT